MELSAEEVRGPPQRNTLVNSAISAYEPGGRGFKSCRARQIIKGLQRCSPFSSVVLVLGCYYAAIVVREGGAGGR